MPLDHHLRGLLQHRTRPVIAVGKAWTWQHHPDDNSTNANTRHAAVRQKMQRQASHSAENVSKKIGPTSKWFKGHVPEISGFETKTGRW